MTNSKRYFYIVILTLFLICGLYINFELDKDFLSQFGFDGFFVIVSITFFIGLKILSELLFFKLKNGIAKVLVGVFALFIIFGSITSIFFVRIYKSESVFQNKEYVNNTIDQQKREASQNRQLVLNQISSIENQINSKLMMIKDLDSVNGKWLRHRYNKEIDKLNSQKLALINEIKTLKVKKVRVEKKKTTLHAALNHAFGTDSNNLTLWVNLIFTIFVDSAILLLCFGLSHILSQSTVKEAQNDIIATPTHSKVLNLNRSKPSQQAVNYSAKEPKEEDFVSKLKRAVDLSPKNQERFAKEELGISKQALWKIMTGVTKNVSPTVKEKIEAII